MPPPQHKRKSVRISVTILVDLLTPGSLVSKGRACIVDLSLGGMAVETETVIDREDELLLRINLPGEKTPQEVFANAVRIQKVGNIFRYGLRYSGISFFAKLRLRNYIHKWIKQQQNKNPGA